MRILRGEGYWFDEAAQEEEFWKIRKEVQSVKYPIYVLSHMLPFYMAPWRKREGAAVHPGDPDGTLASDDQLSD